MFFLSVTSYFISCQTTGQVKHVIFCEKIYIFLTCYSDQLVHLKSSEGPALKELQARGKIPMYQSTNTICASSNKHLLKEIFIHLTEKKNYDIERLSSEPYIHVVIKVKKL